MEKAEERTLTDTGRAQDTKYTSTTRLILIERLHMRWHTPLPDRLDSFLGRYCLRWVSLGAAKEKLRSSDQNHAKKTAY